MFHNDTLTAIREAIRTQATGDQSLLDDLRADARKLMGNVKTIKPRSTTSVSLVASDGGNNKLEFDPFYVQIVRVVDSYGKELFLDVISPTTDTDILAARQFTATGDPKSPLGYLMRDLGVKTLHQLSPMIPDGETCRTHPEKVSPSWVLVYRDLCEWAVLYERICYRSFATDTLIVRDGPLRSKVFSGDLFVRYGALVQAAIERTYKEDRRRIYLVGVIKHSQVLARYRLALAVEGLFANGEAFYVRVNREMERKAYRWPEYARGTEDDEGKEAPKFVLGDMYFVRFGTRNGDPIWPVDLLTPQSEHASPIFGYLLADAIDGFPVPYYPRCLQQAHEHAQVVDFDLDILQDEVYAAVRGLLPAAKKRVVDDMRLTPDVARRRYE